VVFSPRAHGEATQDTGPPATVMLTLAAWRAGLMDHLGTTSAEALGHCGDSAPLRRPIPQSLRRKRHGQKMLGLEQRPL